MSRIYGSALELIGHTPLIEAKRLEKKESLKARLLIKTEYQIGRASCRERV